jgi:hypothetical protein
LLSVIPAAGIAVPIGIIYGTKNSSNPPIDEPIEEENGGNEENGREGLEEDGEGEENEDTGNIETHTNIGVDDWKYEISHDDSTVTISGFSVDVSD